MIFGDPWTDDQRQLATLVFKVWRDSTPARWPNFAYVEHEMYRHGVDAKEVLDSFPVVGHVGVMSTYYADVAYGRAVLPQSDTQVQLTVAGLSKVTGGAGAAQIFMHLLHVAGKKRFETVLDPFTVTPVNITNADFAQEASVSPTVTSAMAQLIKTEPYVVTGLSLHTNNETAGSWTARIDTRTARFANEITVDDYLKEIVRLTTPPPVRQPRVLPSPLALLEALHYLNITWQRHCRRDLLQVGNVAAAAHLAFDVGNEDEFSARLSTLGDLLKTLQTHSAPGVEGHGLDKLKAYLLQQLPDQDDQDSIDRAISILRRITRVRNGLQHAAAATRALPAWQELGLTYPTADWNDTWLTIRAIATEAIMDLRALIERLPMDGCTEHRK